MAKTQKKLEQHPIAKLFPAPDAAALDALRKRIFRVGKLKYPVVLFEGKVIEHWPEYCACLEFDLPYSTTEYKGTAEELVEHLLQTHSVGPIGKGTLCVNWGVPEEALPDTIQSQSISGRSRSDLHSEISRQRCRRRKDENFFPADC